VADVLTPPGAQPHSQPLDILLLLGQHIKRHCGEPGKPGVPETRGRAGQAHPAAEGLA
jgi:hypothetical protein